MAAVSVSDFKDVLIVLATAGVVIPLLKRLGASTILGFLVVGIFLGPHVLGLAAQTIPALGLFAIGDPETIGGLAELGVVFLLFLIGLELSPERLLTMRRLVFGLGAAQVVFSLAAIITAALLLGLDQRAALVIGLALSLSSTAIVVQLFAEEKRLGSQAGRASFAILLMQDLAVVPMLMLVGILGQPTGGSLVLSISLALLQAFAAAAAIVLIGRYALRPLLKLVAVSNSPDLFLAAVLFIALGTGALATAAGLSMALGAFIAGLMLAETEYRRAIEAIIEPFKGLLLGVFFLMVGLRLDLHGALQMPLQLLTLAVAVVVLKALIIYGAARAFRVPRHAAFETALLLGPCGEFAFVIVGLSAASGLLANDVASTVLLVVSLTMMAIPVLARAGRPLITSLRDQASLGEMPPVLPADSHDHQVIIAGFGRVGSLVASMLDEHKLTYLAIDADAKSVTTARKDGHDVYFGDAADANFLRACGIERSVALAVTMDNPVRAEEIVKIARKLNPAIKIIARARDERHAMRLYLAGVTEAVPETIESSLQLGEALLVETGIPIGLAIASVHERRDGFRKLLGRPNRRERVEASRKRLRRKQTMER